MYEKRTEKRFEETVYDSVKVHVNIDIQLLNDIGSLEKFHFGEIR